jgi:hypothetical protein
MLQSRRMEARMISLLAAGVALGTLSCGRPPLDPGGPNMVAAGDAGQDSTNPNMTGTTTPATAALHGTWSGELSVSAPGFAWGPFDRLTMRFASDGTVQAMQFASGFPPPHTYGSGTGDFPLQGSRDAPIAGGSSYPVSVTVEAADFGSDRFHMRYHIVDADGTPHTDYVEEVSGQLQGAGLQISYSATGTLIAVPIAATASGQLLAD